MRSLIVAAAVCLLSACRPVGESEAVHATHSGEHAVLTHANWKSVPVALAKDDVHALAREAEGKDQSPIDALVRQGKAIQAPLNTRVSVISESYNERRIRIEEGEHAGKTGWVPYEWLKPAR